MILKTFLETLAANPASAIHLTLPNQTFVPAHFHVTEVARMQKDFIDCGGTVRSQSTCLLQVWLGPDVDHRLDTSRLAHIIGLAAPILQSTELPIELEYEDAVLSQFPLLAVEVTPSGILLHLGRKHTACLAEDRCVVDVQAVACCAQPGCC